MMSKPRILVVDRSPRNRELLVEFLELEGYEAAAGESLAEAECLLGRHHDIALGLIDVAGLGQDVWVYCARLREEHIPFVVVSPPAPGQVQEVGLACGAAGVLVKPLSKGGLRGLLRGLLEKPA